MPMKEGGKVTPKGAHTKKLLLEALEKTFGIVSQACKNSGISREFYYRCYKTDSAFKAKVDGLSDYALDFAESKLFALMNEKSAAAIIFYLKCRGKKRGYIEKTELAIEDNSNPAANILQSKMANLPLEDMLAIKEILDKHSIPSV